MDYGFERSAEFDSGTRCRVVRGGRWRRMAAHLPTSSTGPLGPTHPTLQAGVSADARIGRPRAVPLRIGDEMRTSKILSVLVVVVMAAAIAHGIVAGELSTEGEVIWSLAWSKVTLVDLYAGLALFGGWVALREPSPFRIAGWWLALAVTGNLERPPST